MVATGNRADMRADLLKHAATCRPRALTLWLASLNNASVNERGFGTPDCPTVFVRLGAYGCRSQSLRYHLAFSCGFSAKRPGG
eukprot:3234412-Prymnesium_polylepis.1